MFKKNKNSFLEKIKGKYNQIKGKMQEKRADSKIKDTLEEKEREIEGYLDDLKSGDSNRVTSASEKVEQALDDLEQTVDKALKKRA